MWTKVCLAKAVFFSVVMYRCESWTIKKAECQRIDAFKLWCWRRLLRIPWTIRRSKSILKEINPEYSLEGLILKLKLQYFGHLMWTANSLEKTLILGKIEGRRRRGRQRIRWFSGITDSMGMRLSKLWGIVKDREAWCAVVQGVAKSQHDWVTEKNSLIFYHLCFLYWPFTLQSLGHVWQELFYWYMLGSRNRWGLPGVPVVNSPPANGVDVGSIPGLGRFHNLWSD